MLRNASAIRARIDRAMRSRIRPAEFGESRSVAVRARALEGEPVPFSEAVDGDFVPLDPGTPWGPS